MLIRLLGQWGVQVRLVLVEAQKEAIHASLKYVGVCSYRRPRAAGKNQTVIKWDFGSAEKVGWLILQRLRDALSEVG